MYLVETVADVARLAGRRTRDRLAYVTQTTLSVDDAATIVDGAAGALSRASSGPKKDDICYATQNRQDAVKFMAPQCDVVIVVGSPNSSNSNRLREVAQSRGIEAYMVDNATELRPEWMPGKRARRRHRRRLGARSAGARGHRPAEGTGREARHPARGQQRRTCRFPCPRDSRSE